MHQLQNFSPDITYQKILLLVILERIDNKVEEEGVDVGGSGDDDAVL